MTSSTLTHDPQTAIPISDEKLYQLCQQYGAQARFWRQKFTGLLPEVFKRKLYEKKGYGSIYEFAAKLAGLSKEQVNRVLNLHSAFEDTPILKRMLENGEVSVNKLARITSVVTSENQEFWADQAKILPNRALETLVRDAKNDRKFVHVHKSEGLKLTPQVLENFSHFRTKASISTRLFYGH